VWTLDNLITEARTALEARSHPQGRYVNGRVVSVLRSPEYANAEHVAVGFSAIPPGASTEAHRHVAEEVVTVLSGSGFVRIDGEQFDLAAGSIIFTPSDSLHRTTATGTEPLVCLWVYSPAGSENRWLSDAPVLDEGP